MRHSVQHSSAVSMVETEAPPAPPRTVPRRHPAGVHDWQIPAISRTAEDTRELLLRHLLDAKAAIAAGEREEACAALVTGPEFAAYVRMTVPVITIADALRDACEALLGERDYSFTRALVIVYAGLEDLDVYAPPLVTRIRAEIAKARAAVREGMLYVAAGLLLESAERLNAIITHLPLREVAECVDRALGALDEEQPHWHIAGRAIDKALVRLMATWQPSGDQGERAS